MHFRSLSDVDVRGKRVVVREDLNVPMKDGAVGDATRIDATLTTLRYLRDRGARTAVLSHLGRPDGAVAAALSLRPVAAELAKRLGSAVGFASDCVGPEADAAAAAMHDGDVVVFENVRFHPEEEANDPAFAEKLARLGDLYVNDAFGTAHRAHASTEGIARYRPAVAGFLMDAELQALGALTNDPKKPFVCAIGGAKVKDKVGVFVNLLDRVSAFVIGGGMANTFLAANGVDVGTSLRDSDLEPALRIIAKAREKNVPLHVPTDAVVSTAFGDDGNATAVPLAGIAGRMILDIGPESARAYAAVLRDAKTIVFNGPMGVYEKPAYQNGTRAIGEAIAAATRAGATSVVGGGDAAAAAVELGFAGAMTHVSTGGGATLEYLEGKTLPGIAALERARDVRRPRVSASGRRPLIAGNWKMNKTVAEARALIRELRACELPPGVDVVVAPPFTALAAAADELAGSHIGLGAQNVHDCAHGAFTGEISPVMLAELGVRFAIVGHSERRAMGETDADVNRKVRAALAHGLTPIVAVGESHDEHLAGRARTRVTQQTRDAFADVPAADVGRCVVAYEPIWAIGSGLSDSPQNANVTIGEIRGAVDGLANARLLYGGSMKPENAAELMAQPDIDGGLIGGASLNARAFFAVIDAAGLAASAR